ncbi:hypothetical protein KY290_036994 [Solanum tuberosum]|uniref:Uncharacterized protein n=1 Tax=Solanum tuberosum TaxID=4113 RepID=A0ABQ7TW44_SOLTU|nr:hypothetical protein KY290_036994 [Solanum tuberosum]
MAPGVRCRRARKRRKEGHLPEEPTSTPLPVGSSETESYDAAVYMEKRGKEVEVERVKSKVVQKSTKKSPLKKVSKRATEQSKPIKIPGTRIQKPVEENQLTREARIGEMENQKVLNGRVFDPDILTEPGMSTLFDSVSLQSWDHLFEPLAPYFHEPKVREFYYKMELLDDGGIRTIVRDVKIHLDEETLGIILGVPVKGIR